MELRTQTATDINSDSSVGLMWTVVYNSIVSVCVLVHLAVNNAHLIKNPFFVHNNSSQIYWMSSGILNISKTLNEIADQVGFNFINFNW